MDKKIKGRECKFAVHIPIRGDNTTDLHLIKESIHYEDGAIESNVRMLKNFKRSFYITKPSKRSFKQKKEYMHKDDLLEYSVTQSELRDAVAKALDMPWSKDQLKQLSVSPYLYGTDITSTSLIKKQYQDKYPDCNSEYSVAGFDIETDVINGTKDVIIASIIFKDKAFIAVIGSFLSGLSMVQERFKSACDKYIKEYLDKYNIVPELYIADDTVDAIRAVFSKAHEWKPDFLEIWNIDFDIPRILEVLEKYNIDPKDILCDPSVPKNYRICKYMKGPQKKVTASGKVTPINPAAQWHTLALTASFYIIDGMCSYKQIRLMSEQEQPSYSLDAILNRELGIRKLKFKEADDYTGLKWHQFMQTNYKIEYMVYNLFDSLSMLELDKKTLDLAFTLPSFAATSNFSRFNSQPTKITDALHYFYLEQNRVIGSTGYAKRIDPSVELVSEDEIAEKEDDGSDHLSLKGWILTLPAHLTMLGLPLIEEDEHIRTGVRCFVFDSDAVAAYPNATSVANVSKATTKRELISIDGIEEVIFRSQNLNLVLGQTNAVEYCSKMFNMPSAPELLKLFKEE